jgi:hypothetical protein
VNVSVFEEGLLLSRASRATATTLYCVSGSNPVRGQLSTCAAVQENVWQPVEPGSGHSCSSYATQGPPLLGGVMATVAVEVLMGEAWMVGALHEGTGGPLIMASEAQAVVQARLRLARPRDGGSTARGVWSVCA